MAQSLRAPRTRGLMTHGGSQPPVTPVPGSLTPLLAPQAPSAHGAQTHRQAKHSLHRIKCEDILETAHSTVRLTHNQLKSHFFPVPSCSCSVLSIRPFPVLGSPWGVQEARGLFFQTGRNNPFSLSLWECSLSGRGGGGSWSTRLTANLGRARPLSRQLFPASHSCGCPCVLGTGALLGAGGCLVQTDFAL